MRFCFLSILVLRFVGYITLASRMSNKWNLLVITMNVFLRGMSQVEKVDVQYKVKESSTRVTHNGETQSLLC